MTWRLDLARRLDRRLASQSVFVDSLRLCCENTDLSWNWSQTALSQSIQQSATMFDAHLKLCICMVFGLSMFVGN